MLFRSSAASALVEACFGNVMLLLWPDGALRKEICRAINTDKDKLATSKDVIRILKKKLSSKDQRRQLLSLTLLGDLVGDCGEIFVEQVVQCGVLDKLVKMGLERKGGGSVEVHDEVLYLLREWGEVREGGSAPPAGRPQYVDAFTLLQARAVLFPPLREPKAKDDLPGPSPIAIADADRVTNAADVARAREAAGVGSDSDRGGGVYRSRRAESAPEQSLRPITTLAELEDLVALHRRAARQLDSAVTAAHPLIALAAAPAGEEEEEEGVSAEGREQGDKAMAELAWRCACAAEDIERTLQCLGPAAWKGDQSAVRGALAVIDELKRAVAGHEGYAAKLGGAKKRPSAAIAIEGWPRVRLPMATPAPETPAPAPAAASTPVRAAPAPPATRRGLFSSALLPGSRAAAAPPPPPPSRSSSSSSSRAVPSAEDGGDYVPPPYVPVGFGPPAATAAGSAPSEGAGAGGGMSLAARAAAARRAGAAALLRTASAGARAAVSAPERCSGKSSCSSASMGTRFDADVTPLMQWLVDEDSDDTEGEGEGPQGGGREEAVEGPRGGPQLMREATAAATDRARPPAPAAVPAARSGAEPGKGALSTSSAPVLQPQLMRSHSTPARPTPSRPPPPPPPSLVIPTLPAPPSRHLPKAASVAVAVADDDFPDLLLLSPSTPPAGGYTFNPAATTAAPPAPPRAAPSYVHPHSTWQQAKAAASARPEMGDAMGPAAAAPTVSTCPGLSLRPAPPPAPVRSVGFTVPEGAAGGGSSPPSPGGRPALRGHKRSVSGELAALAHALHEAGALGGSVDRESGEVEPNHKRTCSQELSNISSTLLDELLISGGGGVPF